MGERRVTVRKTGRIVCAVITMRTSRLLGAAALLVILAMPSPAAAQPAECPPPGLGPPAACVATDEAPVTTLTPEDPADAEPGPALWVGAVFGAAGLAGIALATARVRDEAPEERR